MQTANTILLIRPYRFGFNAETAETNNFQKAPLHSNDKIATNALKEFEAFAHTLKEKKINILLFDDTPFPVKPDAVFPNNWMSCLHDGTIVLYPLYALNRREERRKDILEFITAHFKHSRIVDLTFYEEQGRFLEGTGSIVFDHQFKIAYACASSRTDKEIFFELCKEISYLPVYFTATTNDGSEIYHTNVMLSIGKNFAVLCEESIPDLTERELVKNNLLTTHHQIIPITLEQVYLFAGNMLEIKNNDGESFLVLSQSAFQSLSNTQKDMLEGHCQLLPLPIDTIETIGGGSARCMISEVFLSPK